MGPIAGHPVRQQDDVARHRTGRQKERTVNPEMVPARYNFLYSSSSGASGRPLRGRPRRRVPGTRVARNPQLAAAWPRRAHSRVCLPSMAGGEGEKGGGGFRSSGCGASASRFARRAWDPAPIRGPADLRWQVGMHTARPLSRAGKKFVRFIRHWSTNSRNFSSSSTLDSGRSACAVSTCRPAKGAPLRGYRPASEGAMPLWLVRVKLLWACFGFEVMRKAAARLTASGPPIDAAIPGVPVTRKMAMPSLSAAPSLVQPANLLERRPQTAGQWSNASWESHNVDDNPGAVRRRAGSVAS
jgi:hypothetical protein